MPLGADDIEPAGVDRLPLELGHFDANLGFLCRAIFRRRVRIDLLCDPHFDIATELDVGAATRHVGGDGDRARHARLSDDKGFLLMEARIEHREGLRRFA